MQNYEQVQGLGKEGADATLAAVNATSKAAQSIAAEFADYTRKSFEHGASALEKLLGARSFDQAIAIQADYGKTAYESFVAEATKLGGLYADGAKEAYKPIEGYAAKLRPAV